LPVKTKSEGEAAHLQSHSLEKKNLPFLFRIIITPFNTWNLIPGAMLPLVEQHDVNVYKHPQVFPKNTKYSIVYTDAYVTPLMEIEQNITS
jgi:hypothetical protein